MDSKALFGAKTIACISVFVQLPRPLTCSNFVLGLKNIVQCTQTSFHHYLHFHFFFFSVRNVLEKYKNQSKTKNFPKRFFFFFMMFVSEVNAFGDGVRKIGGVCLCVCWCDKSRGKHYKSLQIEQSDSLSFTEELIKV